MTTKTYKICGSILALATLAGLVGCGVGEASIDTGANESVATPIPVEVVFPQRAEISATYEVTTTIGSEGDAPVLAKVPGEVVELLVEEGEHVEEGQILARLDGERLRLEMLAARANMDKVRGDYER